MTTAFILFNRTYLTPNLIESFFINRLSPGEKMRDIISWWPVQSSNGSVFDWVYKSKVLNIKNIALFTKLLNLGG